MPVERGPGSHEPFNLKEGVLPGSEDNFTPIRELKDNPNKLVREEFLIDEDIDQSVAYYSEMKKLFEELRDSYGIAIPDIDMVIGNNEQEERRVFMVVDKIEGKTLDCLEDTSEKAREKFEIFCINLLRSAFNAYKENRPFFNDIKEGNIMYGHKSKEKDGEDAFFICDVGGGFARKGTEELKEDDYDKKFFDQILDMTDIVREYEQKFGDNVTFQHARMKLKEICHYLRDVKVKELADHPYEDEGGRSYEDVLVECFKEL